MTDVDVKALQTSVEEMHSCSAIWSGSQVVDEEFEGQIVWQGIVHIFELISHPQATRAYAWSSPIKGSDKRRFFAVLHISPVTSPIEAVRAAIVAEHKADKL